MFIFEIFYSSRPISPSSIYLVGGNFSLYNVQHVKEIFIHPAFNSTTMENDLAVIQVNLKSINASDTAKIEYN